MGVDETLLNEIVRRVLTVARPDRIILFGSAATGQMTKDSDIDLLVVEPAPANTHERRVEIRDAVGDIGYPVDVIVMRTERFEERSAGSAALRTRLTSMGASFMKPLDPGLESLLREWIEKAEADLEAAERLAPECSEQHSAFGKSSASIASRPSRNT
jgi:predicted nucleotidyltransferase